MDKNHLFQNAVNSIFETYTKEPSRPELQNQSQPWVMDYLYDIFWSIFGVFSILILCILFVKWVRLAFEIYSLKNINYLKVTLPKADSKLDKENETKKDFKEKVAIMSMFYKTINKMWDVWMGESIMNFIFSHSKVSMELAYDEWQVHFYVSTYKSHKNLIIQHITSIYNDAEVVELKEEDYLDLKPKWYKARAASLWKEYDDVFPIRTFKYMEDDALNNFSNVFWWLDRKDKAVVQFVLKPAPYWWAEKAKRAAWLVAKGEYKSKWLRVPYLDILWNPIVSIVAWPDSTVKDNSTSAPGASEWDAYKIFNQAETESHKIMWESAWQVSFRCSIRVICSSRDEKRAEDWVHAIIWASSMFTDEYNNSLDNPQFLEDSLPWIFTPLRYIAYKYKLIWFFQNISIFSVDELSTMYHFPDVVYNKSPIIEWLEYKKLAPPHNLKTPTDPIILEKKTKIWSKKENWIEVPIFNSKKEHRYLWWFPTYKDGILLGWNEYRNKKIPIYFDKKDRWRHHYVIWKSWGWKSVFIWYLARQDSRAWDWLWVIDPHWDLVEDVLSFIPKERAKDTIVFDPADDMMPMWLNMLEILADSDEARKREMDRAAMDATEIFIKIFWDEIFWPRIQHYFRNGCLTLMEDFEEWWTLIDVPRLFTDEWFMQYKVSKVKNPVVKSFWEHEYANTGQRERQEMIPYFSSKFWPFVTNTTIRNIIWQTKSAFNLRDVMDNQKILLVNLSKGKIWSLNAQLLGLIFVSKLNMAAMARADMPEKDRKEFYLYVDEFQNFATETFWEILSEARKYRLALIMAHQFIAQINSAWWMSDKPSIKDAVFWNAWTMMSFKVWAEDAEYLEKEYSPLLSQQDIIWIANYTTYCKLNINNASSRPFDIKTIWDNNYKNEKAAGIIKEYSKKKYWRKRKYVDMEIEARLWMTK